MSYGATYNYKRRSYDLYQLTIPAGAKRQLMQIARERGHKSLNAYILTLLERDTGLELVLRGELPRKKNSADGA